MSRQSLLAVGLIGVTLAGCAAMPFGATSQPPAGERWVASWGSAQLVPEGQNELPAAQWQDASLRQVVRVSLGGRRLRVKLSNVFGTAPLVVDAASVARAVQPGRADVEAASVRALTFGGAAGVTIPAGAEYLSDPVDLPHAAGTDVAISLHFAQAPARQTGHPGSRATSFLVRGNQVAAAAWPQAETFARWYQVAGVESLAGAGAHTVVAIGDSITDGYGVAPDTYARWTDGLATRLRAAGMTDVGIVNAGIGGGRMLRDGLGPNLVSRFERDVLARPGVSHAIVLIGVNDFGVQHRNKEDGPAERARLVADLEQAWRQIVARAHLQGVCVLGATITPYGGSGYYQPGPENEADRRAYNQWIRTAGVVDGVVDFDAALRDPARPDHLLKSLDNDGLHPSPAGYQAMADAVPLAQLKACSIAR
jgi:lysophospholipase L1-like esterase